MIIAHVTDLHATSVSRLALGLVNTNDLMRRALAVIAALDPRPDLILVSGDIAHGGDPEGYGEASEALRSCEIPAFCVPGNHDTPQGFRSFLAMIGQDNGHAPKLCGMIDCGAVRVIGLDSTLPHSGAGGLCDATLEWLDATLASAPTRPTLLMMHHPPFSCGVSYMDTIRLCGGAARLEEIAGRHPQILALLCGHHHRDIATLVGGRPCYVTPALAYQVSLALDAAVPGSWIMEPSAFRLLRWDGTRLISHLVYTGDFGGPRRFGEAAPAAALSSA